MIVVPFTNQKGGVGKSNVAGNVAGELALRGHRVVLIDVDEQGNLSNWVLGRRAEGEHRRGSAELFGEITAPEIRSLLLDSPNFGLRILAAAYRPMHDLAPVLLGKPERLNRILRACEQLETEVDFIVIDCPPNAGPFTKAALYAATHVVIPFKPTEESIDGIELILSTLDEVREVNDVPLLAVVITMNREGNKYHPAIVAGIRSAFADVPIHVINERIDFQRTVSANLPICRYRPRSIEAAQEIAVIADAFEVTAFGKIRVSRQVSA